MAVLLVIAIVVAIVVPLTTAPNNANNDTGTNQNPTNTSTPTVSNYEFWRQLVETVSNNTNVLDNQTTPQYAALEWLASKDQFLVEYHQHEVLTDNILLERYAVVLFYFATGGTYWFDQRNFLSNSSVCQWRNNQTVSYDTLNAPEMDGDENSYNITLVQGISCNANQSVNQIYLSTFALSTVAFGVGLWTE